MLNGFRVSFGVDKKVLETDSGDGCTKKKKMHVRIRLFLQLIEFKLQHEKFF